MAPTDEHSLHIAMADSRFEEKSEELYLAELEYLYDETRDSILRAVDTEADSTRRYGSPSYSRLLEIKCPILAIGIWMKCSIISTTT